MPQIINTNIASLNAQRNLNRSQTALNVSLERLSSGLRINSAKDDAAGLAITDRFTAQIRGLNQAARNANDGISFAQTAEGALGEVSNALQRIRELSVQASNDSNSATDRQALNAEVSQLVSEVNRIASSTQFNGQNVLDGSLSQLVFQVGANAGQTISVTGVDARGSQLGAAMVSGNSMLDADSNTAAGITAAVAAGDLTIQGTSVDLSGATTVNDVITAINAETEDTDVTAQLASSISYDVTYTANTSTATSLLINGVTIDVASSASTTAVVSAINDVANQTGVTASNSGATITLDSTSNVPVEIGDADDLLTDVDTSATIYAGIDLVADVGTSTITLGGTAADELQLDGGNGAGSASTTNNILSDVNVLTRTDANTAITTVDFALQQVASLRADLGAVQNRFESVIANLETGAENQSASRSRIQDADFAAETAALTRGQILQQAGVSVLAQANALPQNVLALLQ